MNEKTVTADIFDAVIAQTELLELVLRTATERAKEILGREVFVRRNFWGTVTYRSLLMNFSADCDDKRQGFHPYGWFIDYKRPDKLAFRFKDASHEEWKEIDSYNLTTEFYFSINDEEKEKIINNFVSRNIRLIETSAKNYFPENNHGS